MKTCEPFIQRYYARWNDMNYNQHMSNSAFLDYAEDIRFRYLVANGWTMAEFMTLQIGPVVLEDHLIYRREIRLLEEFSVDLVLAGASKSGSRMILKSHFYINREERKKPVAWVESDVLWLDLVGRKPISPPYAVKRIFMELTKSAEYIELAENKTV